MRKIFLTGVVAIVVSVATYGLAHRQRFIASHEMRNSEGPAPDASREALDHNSLPALDAHGFDGVKEITRPELVALMAKFRPLSADENTNLDRGCPGLTCLYQGLGQKRWPESVRGTLGYLNVEDALQRQCPDGKENFIFVKQGCWVAAGPPKPTPNTGEIPLASITRSRPGLYTFNYAVYFPKTATYAWINHREFGFPVNLIRPQRAYLSLQPPPLDAETRPAQIYCSTCR